MKNVVLSDLHLGNPYCNRRAINKVLDQEAELFIVNGDVLDFRYARKLRKDDEQILRRLERMERMGRLVVTKGNHDSRIFGLDKITSLNFLDSYSWFIDGDACYAAHGHKFSSLFSKGRMIPRALDFAEREHYKAIFLGHNHHPEVYKDGDVIYANSGSFIDIVPSYVVITDEHKVGVRYVKEETSKFFFKMAFPKFNAGVTGTRIPI